VAAVAWTLLALGGLSTWSLVPLGLVLAAGLIVVRPRILGRPALLDITLIGTLAAVVLQIVPLPAVARGALSPHAVELQTALEIQGQPDSSPWQPLSIRPEATAASVAYLLLLAAAFWLARSVFERNGPREFVRWVSWVGLAVSVEAVVQLAVSPLLLYGVWRPEDESARPFGPFVNRNHMATWLLLAIPLVSGYLMAHVRARMHRHPSHDLRLVRAIDSTAIWEAGTVVAMVTALLVSLSRSGVIGLGVATVLGFALARAKLGALSMKWIAGVAGFALLIATYLANFDALATRFARAFELGSERAEIWRQTLPIVRDFAATGTGEGTFNRAMLIYQQGDRQLLFNQAHNQYLQVAAEGGLLVVLPAVAAIGALLWLLFRCLRRDTSALFWIRAGAAAGLAAVGVQSLWETGLRMPANGVLFAICAAVAVHREGHSVNPGDAADPQEG
jgi:O-antigen ligase